MLFEEASCLRSRAGPISPRAKAPGPISPRAAAAGPISPPPSELSARDLRDRLASPRQAVVLADPNANSPSPRFTAGLTARLTPRNSSGDGSSPVVRV